MWDTNTCEVGTLRVRSVGGDRPALRLAMDAQLGGADLHPPSLPRSSILVVRRLADPAPSRLHAARCPSVDAAWETAARSALDALARRAARPVHGPVPPGAEAVVFADPAEMLACLALDLSRSGVHGCWWWQHVTRRLDASSLAALFVHQARQLPSALARLAERGQAVAVCGRLGESEAEVVAQAVARSYGLSDPRPPRARQTADRDDDGPTGAVHHHTATDHEDAAPGAPPAPASRPAGRPPEWIRQLDALPAAHRLRPGQRWLLALALALDRAPSRVATPVFRADAERWWPLVAASASAPDGDERSGPFSPPSPSASNADPPSPSTRSARGAAAAHEAEDEAAAGSDAGPHTDAVADLESADRSASPTEPEVRIDRPEEAASLSEVPRRIEVDRTEPEEPRTTAEGRVGSSQDFPERFAENARSGSPEASRTTADTDADRPGDSVAKSEPWLGEGAETNLAGLFYLVNLMVHLDWPAALEDDWRLASRIGVWGVLETLGRALAEPLGEELADDPVWRLLALLGQREPDEPVGRGDDDLARWAERTLPAVRRRLAGALGAEADEPVQLAATLLLVPGRVEVTTTHVEVTFALESISMPVRRAGIDRDPGWLPDFGRVVTFHYR